MANKASQQKRVAIVINLDFAFRRHHEVFAGTQRFAAESDWHCEVWPYPPPVKRGRRKLYDGIVGRVSSSLATSAKSARIPLVNVWRSSPARTPTVTHDCRKAGALAGEHLKRRGCRRFAYMGFRGNRASLDREAGFRNATRDYRSDFSHLLVTSSYSDSSGLWDRFHEKAMTWLKRLKPPVGLFAVDDGLARHAMSLANSAGFRVPEDIAVVGTGNELVICQNPEPSLTSVDLGYEQIGYRAAQLLDSLMDGKAPPISDKLLPPTELIARGSTDAFAAESRIVALALRYIADECHRPIHVADVAKHVHVTSRTLDRHFTKELGRTAAAEIRRMRIEMAKRLLIDSSLPLKAVATASGFLNDKRMCEAFARYEGVTPGEFRRKQCTVE